MVPRNSPVAASTHSIPRVADAEVAAGGGTRSTTPTARLCDVIASPWGDGQILEENVPFLPDPGSRWRSWRSSTTVSRTAGTAGSRTSRNGPSREDLNERTPQPLGRAGVRL